MSTRTSRLSSHSLGGISRFVRDGGANEESHQLRASAGALAQCIEVAVRARRLRSDPATITQAAQALAQGVRTHQHFLTGLDSAWHALYGFAAYQAALVELLRATQTWQQALVQRSAQEGAAFDRAELLAWRTLGEGMLLIDLYEQDSSIPHAPVSRPKPLPAWRRVLRWWRRL